MYILTAVGGMSLGQFPYSDPSKLLDPTNLMPDLQKVKLASDVGRCKSELSIPLHENILKSTSRLPLQDTGGVDDGMEDTGSPTDTRPGKDLESGYPPYGLGKL